MIPNMISYNPGLPSKRDKKYGLHFFSIVYANLSYERGPESAPLIRNRLQLVSQYLQKIF